MNPRILLVLNVIVLALSFGSIANAQPYYYAGVVGDALLQNQAWIWNDKHLYHHVGALPAAGSHFIG